MKTKAESDLLTSFARDVYGLERQRGESDAQLKKRCNIVTGDRTFPIWWQVPTSAAPPPPFNECPKCGAPPPCQYHS